MQVLQLAQSSSYAVWKQLAHSNSEILDVRKYFGSCLSTIWNPQARLSIVPPHTGLLLHFTHKTF